LQTGQIYQGISGVYTEISTATTTFSNGDTVHLQISGGSHAACFKNSILISEGDLVAPTTSNKVGIFNYLNDQTQFDEFKQTAYTPDYFGPYLNAYMAGQGNQSSPLGPNLDSLALKRLVVTDVKRSNDSVFALINGVWVFKYKVASYNPDSIINAISNRLVFDTLKTLYTTDGIPHEFDTLYVPLNTQISFDVTLQYHNTADNKSGGLHQLLWIKNSGGTYSYWIGASDGFNEGGSISGVYIGIIQTGPGYVSYEISAPPGINMIWTLQRSPRLHTLTSL